MPKRWPCTGGMANHDTVLGARNGVDISGASLGLTIAGRGSAFHPYGIGISLHLTIPDDFACKLELVASMLNDTVLQ